MPAWLKGVTRTAQRAVERRCQRSSSAGLLVMIPSTPALVRAAQSAGSSAVHTDTDNPAACRTLTIAGRSSTAR